MKWTRVGRRYVCGEFEIVPCLWRQARDGYVIRYAGEYVDSRRLLTAAKACAARELERLAKRHEEGAAGDDPR